MERASAPRIVRCPNCAGDSRYEAGNPFRPFCSRRCRETDLGAWASERFRLPAKPDEGELGEATTDEPDRG